MYNILLHIDVVGISPIDKVAICGESKFKNEPIDKDVYETLIRRSHLLSGDYIVTKYLLFSLSGFTKWFKTADIPNVYLITLQAIY